MASHPGHRLPRVGDVKTGDAPLLEIAGETVGALLMTDLRITEMHYPAWVAAHDLVALERRAYLHLPPAGHQQAVRALQAAVWHGPHPGEIEALTAALRVMGVVWPWVAPELLVRSFPVTYVNAFNRRHGVRTEIAFQPGEMTLVATAKPSRRPTAEALASLRRHGEWWYRRKIKFPPDPLAELEAGELARTGQTTIARRHSTILQGIQQFEALCGTWTRAEISLELR